MTAVVNLVKDVFDFAGDVISGVGKAVVNTVEFVVDKIIEPVFDVVTNVIDAAVNDPVKTILQIAAIATGNTWALPLIEAADVAIAGGSVEDVLKAAAISYVATEVGSYAGKTAANTAAAIQYGVPVGSEAAATLAAMEAGTRTASTIAGHIIGSGTAATTVAVATGQDPVKAFITGGVGAAVPAVLGQVPGFTTLPPSAQQVISQAVSTQLVGGNVTTAVIGSVIQATGIVTDILKNFDPNKTMTDSQRAIVTDILMGSATAALAGGNVNAAIQAAMIKNGSKALGSLLSDGFKQAVASVNTAYTEAEKAAQVTTANEQKQTEVVDKYNAVRDELNDRLAEQNRLKVSYETALSRYNSNPTDANANAVNSAVSIYNDFTNKLDQDYFNVFKPKLDTYLSQLDVLKQEHAGLADKYNTASTKVNTAIDGVKAQLDPALDISNKAFVEVMDPNFNADQYRELNGLGADTDVYEHWLTEGQQKGLVTNYKDQTIVEAKDWFQQQTGQTVPDYIIERARAVDNDSRDKFIENYVNAMVADREQEFANMLNAYERIETKLRAEGYNDRMIDYLYSSGNIKSFSDEIFAKQRAHIDDLRNYAAAVGDSKGRDSEEYKTAYREALDAMASYGGMGVVKDGNDYTHVTQGKLDPDTLVPVFKGSAWYDPVTGQLRGLVVSGTSTSPPPVITMMPLSEIKDAEARQQSISGLFALGQSAKPPGEGGSALFGNGSGASVGMFPGLQLIAVDDASGGKLYDGGNGFALLLYSDGRGQVINRTTEEIIWITPEETKEIVDKVPQIPPPTESTSGGGGGGGSLTKPPPSYDATFESIASAVERQISEGATRSTYVPPTTTATPPSSNYTWEDISKGTVPPGYVSGGGSTTGGTTGGGTTGGTTGDTGATSPNMPPSDIAVTDGVDTISSILRIRQTIFDRMAEYETGGVSRDEALQQAVNDVAANLGTTRDDLLGQIANAEANLQQQLLQQGVEQNANLLRAKKDIFDRMAEYEATGVSRDEALQQAVNDVAANLGTTRDDLLGQIANAEANLQQQLLQQGVEQNANLLRAKKAIFDYVGRPGTGPTQEDLDTIINLLGDQGAYDAQYDFTGDGVIDSRDRQAIERYLGVGGTGGGAGPGTGPGVGPGSDGGFGGGIGGGFGDGVGPAAGSKWAPTGIYGAINQEAERTRQAQQRNAMRTQRMGNVNTMMNMMSQASDLGGQQVTVNAPDPAKIGYIYDWNSIFANPSQEKMFALPYAHGGVVRNETDAVNDELLKMLKG